MNDQPKKRAKKKLDYNALQAAIGNRECTKQVLLDWVFDHVGVTPANIAPDDWPCFGAVRLLQQAKMDYPGFLALWAKLIPTQTQLKLSDRPKDDGRLTGLLDALEDADSTEGTESEPPIPPKGSGTGGQQPDGAR